MLPNRRVFGAAILSACGALPSHLMPVLVIMWLSTGQATLQGTGLVAAVHSVGVLFALVALPSTGILVPRYRWILLASVLLLGALLGSYRLNTMGLLFVWGLAGMCAGLMQYVGAALCAQASDKRSAFTFRLTFSLLFAGLVAMVVYGFNAFGPPVPFVVPLIVLEIVALVLALHMLTGIQAQSRTAREPINSGESVPYGGLLVLLFLFLGQIGFYVYALRSASVGGGLSAGEVALALSVAKLLAGAGLYGLTRMGADLVGRCGFTNVSFLLVASVVALDWVDTPLALVLGFLLWELSFNGLVAAFQGELAKINPVSIGMWVSVPVFLGAAAGPAIHGWMLAQGWGSTFFLVAALSALGPAIWVRSRTRVKRRC